MTPPAPDLTIDQHKERIAALRESLGMEPLVNEVPLPTLTVKQEEIIPDVSEYINNSLLLTLVAFD